ncbi:hypothetical protein BTA51_09400 [Hahella sp. CCB-MM4]|uniref:eCIS core domain-containing protein n=1 Tax=Hahella sp. (strain CCB-MM4) TaxID=1926491 RepID=UPI000B9BC3BD|nr:DUF4157 domain-containing protein [Hahella sp. CCB-MM4]OZG73985.1 hypothetical protein BTA51_09400 [Hahella sp. CCB-MM4]
MPRSSYKEPGTTQSPTLRPREETSPSRAVQIMPITNKRAQSSMQQAQIQLMEKATVQRQANQTGLPDRLKSGIEQLSGYRMDDVRVHYNSDKPAQLNAHAYTQGTEIQIAPGQEKHLPHEAWHVIQQKQGRVQANAQFRARIPINNDTALEREADIMGNKALRHPPSSAVQLNSDESMSLVHMPPIQLNGDGDSNADYSKSLSLIDKFKPYAHTTGTVLNMAGFSILCCLARKPQYTKMSFKMFSRELPKDFLKLKLSLLSIGVGSHLMGANNSLGALTQDTPFDMQEALTPGQDIFNWMYGFGQLGLGATIGYRGLIKNLGMSSLPIRNIGFILPALFMQQLLSSGSTLMGNEGGLAEVIRLQRGKDKRSDQFPHSALKENANDVISQVVFMIALNKLRSASLAPKMPFFERRRHMLYGGAGMYTAINLSPVTGMLPLLMGDDPSNVHFNPKQNPLDLSRSIIGSGSAGMGISYILNSMSQSERRKFFARLRMGSFGATSLFAGLTFLQIMPIVYMLLHSKGEDENEPKI